MKLFRLSERNIHTLTAVLLFVVLSIFYYHSMLGWGAIGIHDWAQADRLSLAENFYHHGLNIFKPQTFQVYNNPTGITGVELPLQSYLAALITTVAGHASLPLAFRLVTLLFTFLAFMALFKWVYEYSGQFLLSLVAPVFYFTLPIGAYFADGFLPDSTALALVIISLYFLFRFFRTGTHRSLWIAILIAALAALVKMSTAVYFMGLVFTGGIYLLFVLKARQAKPVLIFLGLSAASVLLIAGQYFYIQYLNNTYNSRLFLAEPKPLELSFSMIKYAARQCYLRFEEQYLSAAHWWVLVLGSLIIVVSVVLQFKAMKYYALQMLLVFAAALVGFIMMGKQFFVHQYYILAIVYPLLVFGVVFAAIGLKKLPGYLASAASFTAIVAMVYYGYGNFKTLLAVDYHHHWFHHLREEINQAGVGEEDKIFIAGGEIPNLALLNADRKGVSFVLDERMAYPPSISYFMLYQGLQYLVISPEQEAEMNSRAPCYLQYMDKIFEGAKCCIYKFNGAPVDRLWERKINYGTARPQIAYTTSFEYTDSCHQVTTTTRTGKFACEITSGNEYVNLLSLQPELITRLKPTSIKLTGWIKGGSENKSLLLVMNSARFDSTIAYKQFDIGYRTDTGGWQPFSIDEPFLPICGDERHFDFYIWNSERDSCVLDDITIRLE